MLKLAMIGNFNEKKLSNKATIAALQHSAAYLSMEIQIDWLPAKDLEGNGYQNNCPYDAFWCIPESPSGSFAGIMNAIRFARENNYPYIGTCDGYLYTAFEYARNVLRLAEAVSRDAFSSFVVPLSNPILGKTRKIYLKKNTFIQKIYGVEEIEERYDCTTGLNPLFQDALDKGGFCIAGTDASGEARASELPNSRFYIATLYQPQLNSSPEIPHKLIVRYLLAVQKFHNEKAEKHS